jgi:hypothetical protein
MTPSFAHDAFSSLRSIFDSVVTLSGVNTDQAKESPPFMPPPKVGAEYFLQQANLWLTFGNLSDIDGNELVAKAGRHTTHHMITAIAAFLRAAVDPPDAP